MRLYSLIALGALSLALVPWQGAVAFDETRVMVVVGNMGSDQRDTSARRLLRNQLTRFAQRVKEHRTAQGRHPVFVFQVLPERRLNTEASQAVMPGTDQLWASNTVAMIWGSIDRVENADVPDGTIYLGPSFRLEAGLTSRPILFGPVFGSISSPVDLDAYEIIIGYALLRRMWRERRADLVVPIGNVLKERIREVRHGGSFGSWQSCLNLIERATAEILRRPLASGNPTGPINPVAPVICR